MQKLSEIHLPDMCGGLNVRDPEYGIEDNQSPDMVNLWYKNKALCKRDGQVLMAALGKVSAISPMFGGYNVLHAHDKLFLWRGDRAMRHRGSIDTDEAFPDNAQQGDYYVVKNGRVEGEVVFDAGDWALYDNGCWVKLYEQIASGIADSGEKGVFVEFGNALFFMDGSEIWQIGWDDVSGTMSVGAVVPYEPVVMENCKPDLSQSSDAESFNLIGAGYCVHYHGDGASTMYTLPGADALLDATAVKVVVDGNDLTENTHFTVDRTAKTVEFLGGTSPNGAPASGTNNVWITAYQTIAGAKEKVAGCRVAVAFGGESSGTDGGSRVFVMGNADHPLCYWHSGLGSGQGMGMSYFPDTAEEMLDQNSEPITAAAKMSGELIVFKTHSIFAVGYMFDGQDVYYPVRECHSRIGCDMPGSVQLVDNQLVFANKANGVHMLISSSNALENTVKPLSANVNALLLNEDGLEEAVSCDYERYYWLSVGDSVYLWDYESTPYHSYSDYEKAQRRLAWYRFDGIKANDFCDVGNGLKYGTDDGMVMLSRYKNDFGAAFDSYYVSKAFDLGAPNVEKTFVAVYPSFRGDGDVKATVSIGNEQTDVYKSKTVDIRSFLWDEQHWGAFTWNVVKFAKTFVMKLRMKRSRYLQMKVYGNEKNRGVGLTGLRISYFAGGKIRR